MFIVPATSSSSKLSQAYHPKDNPSGKWYYRKVGAADGFAHDCVLIINNAKIISKAAILSPMWKQTCDLQNKTQLFREVKNTLMEHLFYREWAAHQNLAAAYDELQEKFDQLQKEKADADSKIQELENHIKEFCKPIDSRQN